MKALLILFFLSSSCFVSCNKQDPTIPVKKVRYQTTSASNKATIEHSYYTGKTWKWMVLNNHDGNYSYTFDIPDTLTLPKGIINISLQDTASKVFPTAMIYINDSVVSMGASRIGANANYPAQ